MVKERASPAVAWVVGLEKNPAAPLICAALSHPELEVNELKTEPVLIVEIVMPKMEDAELDNDSAVKSKFAKVAAWTDDRAKIRVRLSLLSGEVIMGGNGGWFRRRRS